MAGRLGVVVGADEQAGVPADRRIPRRGDGCKKPPAPAFCKLTSQETNMTELLNVAIDAHGRWDRWQNVSKFRARVNVGGATWALKGQAGALADVHVTAALHDQHVEFAPFKLAGQHSIYEPARTAIETDDGRVVDSRSNPRDAFAGHQLATPWDDEHLVYFSGYAMWTYLTTPFLLRLPGFETQEIEPWSEEGEQWRRLKVTFPTTVPSHSREQIFYFDTKGLLRRHDYSVDILGGTSSANYAMEYRTFNGLVYPTKRRVYAYGPDNRPLRDRLAVSLDFHEIVVS
jgi:hypothetical protein